MLPQGQIREREEDRREKNTLRLREERANIEKVGGAMMNLVPNIAVLFYQTSVG